VLRRVPRSVSRAPQDDKISDWFDSNYSITQFPITQSHSFQHPIRCSPVCYFSSSKNLEEVITPCAGRQSRAIRVSVLVSPASDVPTVPSRLWGPRVFLGPRGFASGTYDSHSRADRFLGKGRLSQLKNKVCGKSLRSELSELSRRTSDNSPAFQRRVRDRGYARLGGDG
jgi:hypothetical protein